MPGSRVHAFWISSFGAVSLAALLPARVWANQANDRQQQSVSRGVVVLKAESKNTAENPATSCPLPISRSDFRVDLLKIGSDKFDRDLSRRLEKGKQDVTLEIADPFSAEQDPPQNLSRWLEAIRSSGGTVTTLQYCKKTRGLFAFLRRILGSKSSDWLEAAKSYDAIVHVNGIDQSVTQIQFRRRSVQ